VLKHLNIVDAAVAFSELKYVLTLTLMNIEKGFHSLTLRYRSTSPDRTKAHS